MKDFHEQTYYELLDVPANASQEEILKAYNRARSTYGNNSPALYSLFNKEEAQELLKLIDEAYTVLSNPYKRKKYDHERVHGEEMVVPPMGDIPFFTGDEITQDLTTTESIKAKMPPLREMADGNPEIDSNKPTLQKTETLELGTTVFSRYKTDEVFEDQIKACDNFSGEMIHKIRLYKNVTLDQISEMTKVSRAYLAALENDNYTSLPAQVFIRGFLVQISKILNLDTGKVTNSYLRLMKEKQKK